MKHVTYLSSFILIIILFSGCSDVKEIQKMNYATAIGIDYQDDQYIAYVQIASLSSLSNVEGATGEPPEVWVSESSGKTFNDALFSLYNTAQEKITWAHVSSIVLGESAIEHGLKGILDGIIRYNEFRPTPWIFATKEDMKTILSTQGFYNQGVLETMMHNPENIYKQNSLMRPVDLHQLAREIYEPAYTTYLPALSINQDQWVKNESSDPKLMYDGAFFMKNDEYKGFFPLDKLEGMRWITSETERTSLVLNNEDPAEQLFIIIDKLKAQTEVILNEKDPTFKVNIKIEGYVSNQNEKRPLETQKTIDKIKNHIKKDVNDLYLLSQESETDMFNFEYELFKKHPKYWKSIKDKNTFLMQEGILEEVNIDFVLRHSGSGKTK